MLGMAIRKSIVVLFLRTLFSCCFGIPYVFPLCFCDAVIYRTGVCMIISATTRVLNNSRVVAKASLGVVL